MLFFNPGFTGLALAGYFLVVNMAFWLLLPRLIFPKLFLVEKLRQSRREGFFERNRLNGSSTWHVYGVVRINLDRQRLEVNFTDNPSMAWTVTVVIMGLLVTAGYLKPDPITKTNEPPNRPEAQAAQAATVEKNIFKSMWVLLKLNLIEISGFTVLFYDFNGVAWLWYSLCMSYDGGLSGDQIGFCFTLYTLVMLVCSPFLHI